MKRFYLLLTLSLGAILVFTYIYARKISLDNYQIEISKKMRKKAFDVESIYFEKFKKISRELAADPVVRSILEKSEDKQKIQAVFSIARRISGASLVYVMNSSGDVLASTFMPNGKSLVGNSYKFRPYFTRAMAGEEVIYLAKGVTTGKRGAYFSLPVYAKGPEPAGVVVLKLDLEKIDRMLESKDAVFSIISPENVVVSTGRKEWILRRFTGDWDSEKKSLDQLQFGTLSPNPISINIGDESVKVGAEEYFNMEVDLPMEGWRLMAFYPYSRGWYFKGFHYTFFYVGVVFVLLGYGMIILLYRDINERKKIQKKLSFYANMDSLTGALNRRSGMEYLRLELKKSRLTGDDLSICFIDLDNLKRVNDTLGHSEGDTYIKVFVDAARQIVRKGDAISRLGGDEFLLVLPSAYREIAERVVGQIDDKFRDLLRDKDFDPFFSCGIVSAEPGQRFTADQMVREGDRLMYECKMRRRVERHLAENAGGSTPDENPVSS